MRAVTNHVVVEGTAYRLALGAEDVKAQENEECMAEMLARYIKFLPDSQAILAKQYQVQFPEGYELKEKKIFEKKK